MAMMLVDAEEMATLKAVSAYIDEWRLESETTDVVRPLSSDAPPLAGLKAEVSAAKPKRKCAARPRVRREKRELLQLRAESKELQWQLHELRGAIPSSAAINFAEMQKRWRILAEKENLRLRERIQGQLKVVQSMKEILERLTSLKPYRRVERMPTVSTRDFPGQSDSSLQKQFQQSLEEYYLQTDRVFRQNGLSDEKPPFARTQVLQLSSAKTQTEIVQSHYMPFDFGRTGLALWQLGAKNCIHHHTDCHEAATSEDLQIRNYLVTLEQGSSQFHVRGNHSMRKFMESERVVVVFSGVAQLLDGLGDRVSGVQFQERGWIVIAKAGQQTGECCLVQSCCKITLDVATHVPDPSAVVHHLTEALIEYKRKNFRSIHQELENALLDSMTRLSAVEMNRYSQ